MNGIEMDDMSMALKHHCKTCHGVRMLVQQIIKATEQT